MSAAAPSYWNGALSSIFFLLIEVGRRGNLTEVSVGSVGHKLGTLLVEAVLDTTSGRPGGVDAEL